VVLFFIFFYIFIIEKELASYIAIANLVANNIYIYYEIYIFFLKNKKNLQESRFCWWLGIWESRLNINRRRSIRFKEGGILTFDGGFVAH